jgi:eukaryotic-like serine/threonine-protein kinase
VEGRVVTPPPVAASAETTLMAADDNHTAARAMEEEEPKRRWGLTAFLIALVLIAAGIGVYSLLNANRLETVAVPRVVGQLQAEAEATLIQAKLQPRVVQSNGANDNTVGRVTSQTPLDSTVSIGTEVTIEVNVGPAKAAIPAGLVGQDKDSVLETLRNLGFTKVTAQVQPSETVTAKADEVVSIVPAEGTKVTVDSEVTVYYASGESPVPLLRGLTKQEAIDELERSGFTRAPSFSTQVSATAIEGTVISQSPAVNTVVKRTSQIKLVLAVAPATSEPTNTSESPEPSDSPEPTDTETP